MVNNPVGMASIVSQLTTGITSAGLFGTVSEIIPFVIVMIGFAFGLILFVVAQIKSCEFGEHLL